MRNIIFIKHSRPQVDPVNSSETWPLSDEGKSLCGVLAARLVRFDPAAIIASEEPKARQTGQILAETLNKPLHAVPGLQEHDRSNVPHMPSREFISWMALFFQRPGERVLGRESADEALARFSAAVEKVLADHPSGDLAIVTHGTVLSLYAAKPAGVDPFQLWRRMGLPSYLVLSHPEQRCGEIVESVE